MADELLDRLTIDLTPVPPGHVARRLLIGTGAGMAVSAILLFTLMGLRPDLDVAVTTPMFWLKQSYTVAMALAAGFAAERLARPAASLGRRAIWIAVPVLFLACIAAIQYFGAPQAARGPLILGETARVCSLRILLFAIPPLAGLIWAMRGLAPVNLRRAGAAIGLAAGGAGAFVYALYCAESAAPFLLIWYTLGMAAAAAAGAILGPRLLYWR